MIKKPDKIIAILLSTAAFIMITAPLLFAANSRAGTAAYSFLKIGVGAKSQAMGGAFVGLADDESALFYNPAGLTIRVENEEEYDELLNKLVNEKPKNRFIATYLNYLLDFQYGYLGYIREYDDRTNIGFSAAYQNYGDFQRLDVNGNPPAGESATFGASDLAFGVTYSYRVNPKFSFGTTGKVIYQKIDINSSMGLALDAGVMYLIDDEGSTRTGLMLSNFGAQLSGMTTNHKDPLPTKISGGISHQLRGIPLLFSGEIGKPFDNDFYLSLGGELVSLAPFYLRMGWTTVSKDYRTDSDKDLLAGFGGGFGYVFRQYKIDYSYSSYADLGSAHRITFASGF